MQTDNKTAFGIKDDVERAALIVWSITVLLTSLIGDSIILIATLKYGAIKKHKVIVAVMQHMAVCDLLQAVFRVFPNTLAKISDRWVMGELLCHIQDNTGWACAAVTTFLTCAMTTLKLMIVKRPLKTMAWSSRFAHKVCYTMWLLVLVLYTPVLTAKIYYLRDTLYFSYNDYECNYNISSGHSRPTWYVWYFIIGFPAVKILSHVILFVTSILLLVRAKRSVASHGESLRWEGVVTVLLTVAVMLLSYLPITVTFVTWLLGVKYSATTWRAVASVQYLNIMANFFVYSVSVKSFREFLKVKTCELLSLMGLPCELKPQKLQRQGWSPKMGYGSSVTLANFEIQRMLTEGDRAKSMPNISMHNTGL